MSYSCPSRQPEAVSYRILLVLRSSTTSSTVSTTYDCSPVLREVLGAVNALIPCVNNGTGTGSGPDKCTREYICRRNNNVSNHSTAHSTNNISINIMNQIPNKYVTELRLADVLFGRGSGPNDHEGNIRFRQYVAERKAQYMSTNHRMTKTKIAKEIVNRVHDDQGRFVKRVEPNELRDMGLPEDMECYELVDEETILEKAKQALRQNTAKLRGDLDPLPATFAAANEEVATVSTHSSVSHYSQVTPISRNSSRTTSATLQSVPHHRDALSIPLPQGEEPDDFEPIPLAAPARAPLLAPPQQPLAWGNYVEPLQQQQQPINPQFEQAEAQLRHLQQQQMQQVYAEEHLRRRSQILMPPPSQYDADYTTIPPPALVPSSRNLDLTPLPSTHRVSLYCSSDELQQSHNYSMAQLPPEDFDQRRTSMTVQDLELARDRVRSSFQQSLSLQQATQPLATTSMDEMMDSFSQIKMGAGGPTGNSSADYDSLQQRRMMASTETMGTIEPLGSVADMSLMMGSSTFSLFRANNDSVAVMEESLTPADLLGAPRSSNTSSNGASSRNSKTSSDSSSLHFSSDALFSFGGDGNYRRKSSSVSNSINGLISDVRRQVEDVEGSAPLATLPRTIGVMVETPDELDSMNESSLSSVQRVLENASSPPARGICSLPDDDQAV
jgi:hypothetical protein